MVSSRIRLSTKLACFSTIPVMSKKKIWISYSWKDNQEQDVDFVAQELQQLGLEVLLDRVTIGAGKRLWEQIETFITSPTECDVWLWFATQNSLTSEPCKEELAYALDRALQNRGNSFPMIALTPRNSAFQQLPASVRTRLCVSLTDPNWKERIAAAAENRQVAIPRELIAPFSIRIFTRNGRKAIEVRPRTGYWNPFLFAVPVAEKDRFFGPPGNAVVCIGPRGMPNEFMFIGNKNITSENGEWFGAAYTQEVSGGTCGFFICDELPSKIVFGTLDGWYVVEKKHFPLESSA